MRKLLCLILCGLILLGGIISACQRKKHHQTEEMVEITISNWPNPDKKPAQYESMTKRVAAFEKQYPNIRITGDQWEFNPQTYMEKAEGGTLPTLYVVPYTETQKIIKCGYGKDITQEVKQYGYYDHIIDFHMNNISKGNKIYFLPSSSYAMGLFMNLDLMDRAGYLQPDGTPIAPKTFHELIETAEAITKETGKAGFILPTTNNLGGFFFTVIAWNFGTKFIEYNDEKPKAAFDSPECVRALQYIKDLKWVYRTLPEEALISYDDFLKRLTENDAAMTLFNNSIISDLTNIYGMSKDLIGLASVPAGSAAHVTLIGGAYCAVAPNATPEQIDAVFKYIEFDYSENQEALQQENDNGNYLSGLINLNSKITDKTNSDWKKECNVNPNHIRLFNEESNIGYQTEEEVCAQDLYATLDLCIQEVLADQNADCAQILKKAAENFQKNYLDYE